MRKRPITALAVMLVMWICLCRCLGWGEELPLPGVTDGTRVVCRGTVCEIEEREDRSYVYMNRLTIAPSAADSARKLPSRDRIRVRAKPDCALRIGAVVQAEGEAVFAKEATNDGQYDACLDQRVKRIVLDLQKADLTVCADRCAPIREGLRRLRRLCVQRLVAALGEEAGGVTAAMLCGDKSYLDDEIRDWYQVGGISHILAISGLHISLIGMALFRGLRKTGLAFVPSTLCSGCLMLLYTMFTGAGTATCRAFLMFLVFLGAECLGRTYDLTCALAFAVVLMLLSRPLLLFTAGFQLSVLAVLGIALLHPVLRDSYGKRIAVGVSVQLMLLPCILWHFFVFPLYGILLNLVVLPLLPFVMTLGMAVLMLSGISLTAARFVGIGVRLILLLYRQLCRLASVLPFSQICAGRPPAWAVLLYAAVLAAGLWCLSSGRGRRMRPALPFLLSAVICLLHAPTFRGFTVSFLDVGQGDCIFMQTQDGTAMLCDGGSSSVSAVGRYRILPFLQYHGIRTLDCVFLTHMDEDHIGGVRELLEMPCGVRIETLVLPRLSDPDETYREMESLARARGTAVRYLSADDEVRAGELSLRCLHPDPGFSSKEKNETSLALHVQYKTFDLMLMGDLEKEGERALLRSGRLLRDAPKDGTTEILKAGHHGSANATSEALLDQLRPGITILSYGEGNRYGHPSPQVMERLAAGGYRSLATAECGQISFYYGKEENITVRCGKP